MRERLVCVRRNVAQRHDLLVGALGQHDDFVCRRDKATDLQSFAMRLGYKGFVCRREYRARHVANFHPNDEFTSNRTQAATKLA
jgi:hypothetical protein